MIKIEDFEPSRSVLTEKVVCFERKGDEYMVYLLVVGFDVAPEDSFKGVYFRDKLPLYIIPESKLGEHMDLFIQTFYDIEIKEKL